MASSHMPTDACSIFTNWQSRGAWGGIVERPPSPPLPRPLHLLRARPVALGLSTRPREEAGPRHCLGYSMWSPTSHRLLTIRHPGGDRPTCPGYHPVVHPGGAPPACRRSISLRSPTPCGTTTTAGSTTASTTAAWRRPTVSAPAPPRAAPPARRSTGAGATARSNLPPCRACRAPLHLRRCRRPDRSGRTLAGSPLQCGGRSAQSATQERRGPTLRARPRFLVAGGWPEATISPTRASPWSWSAAGASL